MLDSSSFGSLCPQIIVTFTDAIFSVDSIIERVSSPVRSPVDSEDVILEGVLSRKHEWESTTKKASHRSWEKALYIVVKKSSVVVFKDQKHYTQEPGKSYRGDPPADLRGAVAAVPPDYTKRKNVFRLKLANGAEFLFEAKNTVSFLVCIFLLV